jgi:RecA-family ATPase
VIGLTPIHAAPKNLLSDAPLWTPEGVNTKPDSDPKIGEADTESRFEKAKTNDPPLPFINIAAWQDQLVPERQWTVKDRIPRNNVTLLSGEGSIGKSILALQLSTAVVLGRDWLGALPEPGPALVVACEDDANELWRRLD